LNFINILTKLDTLNISFILSTLLLLLFSSIQTIPIFGVNTTHIESLKDNNNNVTSFAQSLNIPTFKDQKAIFTLSTTSNNTKDPITSFSSNGILELSDNNQKFYNGTGPEYVYT
jgi:hypothetical protein